MLCRNPYIRGNNAYPCGRCYPCLKVRRRTVTHRIMLESLSHKDNCFITLTYDDKHLPKGGSLAPEEIRDWLKRFRKSVEPRRIRYFCVGEYGDETWRPHYHAAIFGYPKCVYGLSRYSRERKECCPHCDKVRDTWGRGNVYVGSLEAKSAQYIAGYVSKKMTRFDDPRLQEWMRATGNNLHPEFARMSLKPGLGADYMHEIASTLLEYDLDERLPDVPTSLQHGRKSLPLGRYLRGKLREYVGMEKNAPIDTLQAMEAELLDVLASQGITPEALQKLPGEVRRTAIKNAVVDAGAQRVRNMENRQSIFEKRKPLDG